MHEQSDEIDRWTFRAFVQSRMHTERMRRKRQSQDARLLLDQAIADALQIAQGKHKGMRRDGKRSH